MLNTVMNVLETVGAASAGLAKVAATSAKSAGKIGASAVMAAEDTGLHAAKAIGAGAAAVGSGVVSVVKAMPKKSLFGIAAAAVVVGGAIYAVKYLKARGELVQATKEKARKAVASNGKHGKAHAKKKHAHHAPN